MGFLRKDRTPTNKKLTPAKVIKIKAEQERLILVLANHYDVTRQCIRNVLMEKTWRQVHIRKSY